MPILAIGGIQTKGFIGKIRFNYFALRSFSQAKHARGNLGADVTVWNGISLSISLWEDRQAMKVYVLSGAHRAAMRNASKMGEVLHFSITEADQLPSKAEAIALWRADLRAR